MRYQWSYVFLEWTYRDEVTFIYYYDTIAYFIGLETQCES